MGCDVADVEVVGDHEYWGVGVAEADADVVEFAVVAQGAFEAVRPPGASRGPAGACRVRCVGFVILS